MKLLQIFLVSGTASLAVLSHAGAQAPAADTPAAVRAGQPYLPPALRKPLGSGPVLLRYQPMEKLRKRFDAADLDGSGTLSRDEAHKAGLTVVEKNFDHIDTSQRGQVSFDDLQSYLIQRREEARSR